MKSLMVQGVISNIIIPPQLVMIKDSVKYLSVFSTQWSLWVATGHYRSLWSRRFVDKKVVVFQLLHVLVNWTISISQL